MPASRVERRLAAILAADVVGYSALMERDEDRTLTRLKALRKELIDPLITEYQGRIVKLMGDGALVEFASVVDAVRCAVHIQQGVAEREAETPEDQRIRFRIGINLGDVIHEADGDLYGDGVNVAARLEQLAEPGGLVVSGTAYDHLQGKLDLPVEFAGEQRVKNIERLVRAYRVRLDNTAARPRMLVSFRSLRKRPRAKGILALVLLVAGAVLAAWYWRVHDNSEVGLPAIAVLPFAIISDDVSNNYLSKGITEEVIAGLSRFRELTVISYTSTAKYEGQQIDIQKIRKDLNVRYIVEGGVRISGNSLVVTSQLIDTANGRQLWADRLDRKVDDFFEVQTEVAGRIVSTLAGLGGEIARHELQQVRRRGTNNLEAYQYVLLSEQLNITGNRDDQLKSREILEKAIALDPSYALAYANLSFNYTFDKMYHWGEAPDRSITMAVELAKKAVALDDSEAECHYALGFAYEFKGELERAAEAFQRGINVNPNHANIRADFGGVLQYLGRPMEGIESVKKAMRLNPYFDEWYFENLGKAHFTAHLYNEAIAALQPMANPSIEARLYLAASLGWLGRIKEARAAVDEILKLDPDATVSEWGSSQPFRHGADSAHFTDGLRKAGLPER